MIKQIEHLIKTDIESQDKFKELKIEYTHQKKVNYKRTKTTAVVLALATVISLLFLLYAFQIKNESDRVIGQMMYQIEKLESKLKDCN